MKYLILIFQSTHQVLRAEKILTNEGFPVEIIPTPKEITSECGMSIRLDEKIVNRQQVQTILNEQNIDYKFYEKVMR